MGTDGNELQVPDRLSSCLSSCRKIGVACSAKRWNYLGCRRAFDCDCVGEETGQKFVRRCKQVHYDELKLIKLLMLMRGKGDSLGGRTY